MTVIMSEKEKQLKHKEEGVWLWIYMLI